MWSSLLKESKKTHQVKKKKIGKKIEIINNRDSPNDFFEIRYSSDLIDHLIYLENYFDKSYISILNRNDSKKEYSFIELIKNNIILDNDNYYNVIELYDSDDDIIINEDIICK